MVPGCGGGDNQLAFAVRRITLLFLSIFKTRMLAQSTQLMRVTTNSSQTDVTVRDARGKRRFALSGERSVRVGRVAKRNGGSDQ